jgi:hypothetical protein
MTVGKVNHLSPVACDYSNFKTRLFNLLQSVYQNIVEMSVPMAELSEARTVFGCSSTGIVVSNPTRDMDVCQSFSVLCRPVCRKRPCVGPIPRTRSPTNSPI